MEPTVTKPTNLVAWTGAIAVAAVVAVALLMGTMAVFRVYGVWAKQKGGEAELAEAEFSKQVKVEEARANLEAEKLNALAEVERAKGAAESIKIEGGQLTENYIKYLWVRQLNTGEKQLIYVPTEAGLPLLEAARRP